MNLRLAIDDPRVQARQLIGRAHGFDVCPPEVLDELVAAGHLKHFRRGEFATRRGDPPGVVAMVVTGLLESNALQANGHRHFVGLIPPSEFFGLIGFIDRLPQTHDVTAREETTLLMIAEQALQRLRAGHPPVVRACEMHVVRRLRLMYERQYADPGMPLEARVANMVSMIGRLYGNPVGPHIELAFKLTQADLADWLGLSRQRVNFALKQLETERLIRLHYTTLTITNPQGLEARTLC
jgi:CRP/FNR family cyclic AMP-dependent transcriptional regulator